MHETANKSEERSRTLKLGPSFGHKQIRAFREYYLEIDPASTSELVLDFSATDHLDSAGLGMLIGVHKHFEKALTIRIVNCNDTIRKIFRIAHLEKLLDFE